MHKLVIGATVSVLALVSAAPALAQDAGDVTVRISASRTKLVDEGPIFVNGVQDPTADYTTRATYHATIGGTWFPIDDFGIDLSLSSPATTNNVPAGSLAGTPNLGDDEFVLATLGARFQPLTGTVSPYVAGGLQLQFTTQERDGLGVNLNIPNSHGPYVEGGVEFNVDERWGLFVAARKAWYHTNASGLLPLDATFTNFANVTARAELDPLTLMAGITARLGRSREAAAGTPIGPDTTRWTLRGGLTSLRLRDQLDLEVAGAPFPGAGLSTFEHATPTVQIGYFMLPNVALNATLGFPPTITIYGAGSIGALPALGRMTYGPSALTVQYHPLRHGRIRPYVGAGFSYMFVFDTDDGAFSDLSVEEDLGLAFEAGTEIMLGQRWGMFFDVKHALLRTTATGTFNGLPVLGRAKVDPWAFSGGISFHF